ncbi:hypothetical protein IMSAGC022_01179 [Alistipes sp.]|nr:hypothetical protein IMSAGC022_01179 [Alistipes sp.]
MNYGDLTQRYKPGDIVNCEFRHYIDTNGVYTFQVKIAENDEDPTDFSKGQLSEISPEFRYEKPVEKLPAPTGLRWSSESKGVALWDLVENASGYKLYLLKDGRVVWYISGGMRGNVNLSDRISGGGYFHVQSTGNHK